MVLEPQPALLPSQHLCFGRSTTGSALQRGMAKKTGVPSHASFQSGDTVLSQEGLAIRSALHLHQFFIVEVLFQENVTKETSSPSSIQSLLIDLKLYTRCSKQKSLENWLSRPLSHWYSEDFFWKRQNKTRRCQPPTQVPSSINI